MKYFFKVIYIIIVNILIFLSKNINAQGTTINILLDKPDNITEGYSEDTNISFTFISNIPNITETTKINKYDNYIEYVIQELNNSTYDMMILDEKVLFSDIAHIESSYVENNLKLRKSYQYYLDITDYINNDELYFHDPSILEKGYVNDHLYGLPFSSDFDLYYYNNNDNDDNDDNSTNIVLDNINWNDFAKMRTKANTNNIKNLLGLSLDDDEELLQFFAEYMVNSYNILPEKYENNFEMFYNKNSKEIFNNFKNFISNSSTLNSISVLNITQAEAYNSFINDETDLFKGKASQYSSIIRTNQINNDKTLLTFLPPGNTSVKSKKFLVINRNSKIDSEKLVEIALTLTSKDMQLFRAENFGDIPTYDFNQRESDEYINYYCNFQQELCTFLTTMKAIDIKDFFKGQYNSPYMEIQLLLPKNLRSFLNGNEEYERLSIIFDNIKNLIMDQWNYREIFRITIYIPMAIFIIIAIVVMILIYSNKNHPYLKPYSPLLSLLIIFGFVLRILSPLVLIRNNSVFNCHVFHIYDTIQTDLVVFPMFAITYRIYKIYSVSNSHSLNNKHLFYSIMITIGMMVCFSLFISLYFKSYVVSSGNIETYRHPICKYDDNFDYSIFERWINRFVFFGMVIMIFKSLNISKSYGQFSFVYVLIMNFLIEHTEDFLLSILPSNKSITYYIMIFLVSMFMYALCIYLLIGKKLYYVFKSSSKETGINQSFSVEFLNDKNFIQYKGENDKRSKVIIFNT
ncbi:hypothetical protein BCR32DRAFT_309252 [Anaeromyces robustus]|uniref:G-protein coupled receptors family 3 profile domain-containing protein n=1 Tax=Anaeromyces robustus TaxID=1754192 RepID=A0A1Y1X9Q9_9FUNG|nr:hypothetical protein BCR32DRAFT_309252 [Anaeromyces robustus]|eukprot:ORX82459.1 hypothetical protein BCR32DRAFT_309252 [Anaeromyces robustus]